MTKASLTKLVETLERMRWDIVKLMDEQALPPRSNDGDYLGMLKYQYEDAITHFRGKLAREEYDPEPKEPTHD